MATRGFFSDPSGDNTTNNPDIQVQKKKASHITKSSKGRSINGNNSFISTTTTTTTHGVTTSTTTTTTTGIPTTSTTTTTTTHGVTTSTTTTTTTAVPLSNTLYMSFGVSSYVYGSSFSLQTNCSIGSQNAYLPPDNIVLGTLVYVYPNWPTMIQPGWIMEYDGSTYSIYGASNITTDYSLLYLYGTYSPGIIPACAYVNIIPPGQPV